MNERDKLIKEIGKLCEGSSDAGTIYWADDIADFILADRRRVVEPLVKLDLKPGTLIKVSSLNMSNILEAISQTLKLAGITNKD